MYYNFEDKRCKHGNQKHILNEKDEIGEHIPSIFKIDSHYTRAHSQQELLKKAKILQIFIMITKIFVRKKTNIIQQ